MVALARLALAHQNEAHHRSRQRRRHGIAFDEGVEALCIVVASASTQEAHNEADNRHHASPAWLTWQMASKRSAHLAQLALSDGAGISSRPKCPVVRRYSSLTRYLTVIGWRFDGVGAEIGE